MADQDRKASTTTPSIVCTSETKAKYTQAGATLNVSQAEVADLAIEALLPLIKDEETPEQRRARILAKSKSTSSRVRPDPDSGSSRVRPDPESTLSSVAS